MIRSKILRASSVSGSPIALIWFNVSSNVISSTLIENGNSIDTGNISTYNNDIYIYDLQMNPEQNAVAMIRYNGTPFVLPLNFDKNSGELSTGLTSSTGGNRSQSGAFSPNGKYIATSGDLSAIYLWNYTDSVGVGSYIGPYSTGTFATVSFNNSGTVLSSFTGATNILYFYSFNETTGTVGSLYSNPASRPTVDYVATEPYWFKDDSHVIVVDWQNAIYVYEWDDTTGFGTVRIHTTSVFNFPAIVNDAGDTIFWITTTGTIEAIQYTQGTGFGTSSLDNITFSDIPNASSEIRAIFWIENESRIYFQADKNFYYADWSNNQFSNITQIYDGSSISGTIILQIVEKIQ